MEETLPLVGDLLVEEEEWGTKSDYADEEEQILNVKGSSAGRSGARAVKKPREVVLTPKTEVKKDKKTTSEKKKTKKGASRQRPRPKLSNSIGAASSGSSSSRKKQKTPRKGNNNGGDKPKLSYAAAVKGFMPQQHQKNKDDKQIIQCRVVSQMKLFGDDDDLAVYRGALEKDEVALLVITSLRDPGMRTEDDVDLSPAIRASGGNGGAHWLDLSKMTLKDRLPLLTEVSPSVSHSTTSSSSSSATSSSDDDDEDDEEEEEEEEEEGGEVTIPLETPPAPLYNRVVGLDLSGCLVRNQRMLGGSIAGLGESLRFLDVSNLGLYYLPEEWGCLGRLAILRAKGNNLPQWPERVFGREVVPIGTIQNGDEQAVPTQWIGSPLGLAVREVDLSLNGLTEVPENVKLLKKLRKLDVSTNEITYVDDALFTQLPLLGHVDLQNNNALQELGASVCKFLERTKGNHVDLHDCPHLRTPPADITEGADIIKFFEHHKIAEGALQQRRHRAFLAERDTHWLKRIKEIDLKCTARAQEWDSLFSSSGGAHPPAPPRDDISETHSYATPIKRPPRYRRPSSMSLALSERDDDDDESLLNVPHSGPIDSSQRIAALVLRLEREAEEFGAPDDEKQLRRVATEQKVTAQQVTPKKSSSSPNLLQPPVDRAQMAKARGAEAIRDKMELLKILKRLACDERQAVEVFACFCSPRELQIQEPGRPPQLFEIPQSHQLQLMREVKAMIDAIPAPQREIVPAARWPTDVVNALLRVSDTGHRSPTHSPRHLTEDPAPEPLKPRIFHFAGHCVKSTTWWLRGRKQNVSEKACLVWSTAENDAVSKDLGFTLPPDEELNFSAASKATATPTKKNRLNNAAQNKRLTEQHQQKGLMALPAKQTNIQRDIAETPALEEFIDVLKVCDGLELCFLNACHSKSLAKDILKELGTTGLCIICWETAVSDKPASTFARYFYQQIGTRPCIDVEDAFNHALAKWKKNFREGDPHDPKITSAHLRPHGIPCFLRPDQYTAPPTKTMPFHRRSSSSSSRRGRASPPKTPSVSTPPVASSSSVTRLTN